ncbi:hypothetical protein P3T76_000112 [Phytophthora citrophthora]|uniref:Uncharacterized protein n=1 Tax=Phytophthora citrophthora TaxID=4793 RepID=A0AAD9H011_9STRA|nr:hypothetical protein P3T76_000112 [Phytophthora citrophthora]
MRLPPPLLVTSAHCIELTIAVPSWTNKDKEAAHKPVLVHANELLVQVRNIWECSSKVRRNAEERIQAALLEPDPLGSTAAMLEFARAVNDRTKLVVDKLRVQIFVGGVSRVEFILADLNARTTDALWEDVKDPTLCVDYSPDHFVQTRFKAMSFMLSVGVNPADTGATAKTTLPTIYLMKKAPVVIRVTRFYHRKEIAASWKRHMQLVDVNCGAMKLELGVAEFMEMYTVASTFCNWLLNGKSPGSSALSAPMDGMAADREPLGSSKADQPHIELQITFRITIEAKFKFTSPTEGPQELVLTADRSAGNIIFHKSGVREFQMSLHELAVRFRGYVVFRLKPDREIFHVEQRFGSLSVRWRVQSILCRIDDDLVAVLIEMHRFVNEKEEAIVIRCGTCHQQISLDMIDVHVCPPRSGSRSMPSTPHSGQTVPLGSRRNSFAESSSVDNSTFKTGGDEEKSINMNGPPIVHAVLHMGELELQTGSGLVKLLLGLCGVREPQDVVGRTMTTKLLNLRLTTESNEFSGGAVFVPALPLAFQMLECSLQGCGCILGYKGMTIHEDTSSSNLFNFRWPAHFFLDITHFSISAQDSAIAIENIKIRSSFSDGSRICSSSQPQLSFHVNMDKMRCRLDDTLFKLIRQIFEQTGSRTTMMALFFGVLQVRVVEFTLQNNSVREARAKSLLKHAIVVFDNQLGFLCTQSSLDFKTILNSQRMQFVHRQAPVIRTNFVSPIRMEVSTPDETNPGDDENENAAVETGPWFTSGDNGITEPDLTEKEDIVVDTQSDSHDTYANAEIKVEPPELEREDACRCIQRVVRRKNLVRQQKQRFKADDYEPGLINPIQTSTQLVTEEEPKLGVVTKPPSISSTVESSNSPTPSPRKSNMGIPSPIMILNPDSDFVGEIRGGINKLMSPLSRTPDSIRGGINKLMGPINRSLSPTGRRPSTESAAPIVEVACYNVATAETCSNGNGVEISSARKPQELRESTASSDTLSKDKSCTHLLPKDATGSSKRGILSSREDTHLSKLNGLSEAELAALPEVVRVLVQVGECRVCVVVNPRENVEYLCREIVRRYNECFSTGRGSITFESLQDKHGGVFSPKDTVAVVIFLAPSELLFAHPHEQNGQIRSLAWVTRGSSSTARTKACQDPRPGTADTDTDRKRLRCSRLPLPLVIALLANESERELIRLGSCKRPNEETDEDWPDLALNAASLNDEINPLVVEIAWHDTSIEVTNDDVFALCRQLLGLCTSRATSKYVGKILRGRLKVDSSNPLVEWACRRRVAMVKEENTDKSTEPSTEEQMPDMSYEQLKKVVQDTYGVYTP